MSDKIKNYLGIDWGEKRIGLAVAESETRLATPYKVVEDIKAVKDAIRQEKITEIIVGHPKRLSDNVTTKKFQQFYEDIKKKIDLPITLMDERWSTKAISSLPGTKKSKAARDSISAMIILQTYLDSNSRSTD
jgi:putative holliday junction resolvase